MRQYVVAFTFIKSPLVMVLYREGKILQAKSINFIYSTNYIEFI